MSRSGDNSRNLRRVQKPVGTSSNYLVLLLPGEIVLARLFSDRLDSPLALIIVEIFVIDELIILKFISVLPATYEMLPL